MVAFYKMMVCMKGRPLKTINLAPSKENKRIVNIPDSVGRGTIELITVRPGLYLSIADYSLFEEVRFTYSPGMGNAQITGVGFCLSGYGFSHPQCFKKPFKIASGQSISYSFPAQTGFCETIKSKRMLDITLVILPEFIDACLKNYPELIPGKVRLFFGETHQNTRTFSPAVQSLLNQILACPFTGLSRQFFIEGKVMEILARLLRRNRDKYSLNKKDHVKSQEIANIRKAADMMRLSQGKDQHLDAIAKSVGMCRSRFHKCFGLVYGMSPFEYLKQFRMETAKSLIANGGMSITEIAYSVGYLSLSHFAKAFKVYEGVLPSEFKTRFEKGLINDSVIEKNDIVSIA